jgi:hypothetical protein
MFALQFGDEGPDAAQTSCILAGAGGADSKKPREVVLAGRAHGCVENPKGTYFFPDPV